MNLALTYMVKIKDKADRDVHVKRKEKESFPGYFISDSALWLNNEYRKQTKSQVLHSLAKLLHFIRKTERNTASLLLIRTFL